MEVFCHLIVFLTSQIEFEFSFTRYNLKVFRFLYSFSLGDILLLNNNCYHTHRAKIKVRLMSGFYDHITYNQILLIFKKIQV